MEHGAGWTTWLSEGWDIWDPDCHLYLVDTAQGWLQGTRHQVGPDADHVDLTPLRQQRKQRSSTSQPCQHQGQPR